MAETSGVARITGCYHGEPSVRLTRMTMLQERREDFLPGGFDDLVGGIGAELRTDHAREEPTGPGAPATLVAPWLVHAIRQVLKMYARIPNEDVVWHMAQEPAHRRVRQGPGLQLRFVTPQVGAEAAVEFQHRPGNQSALPQILAVSEGGEIEISVTRLPVRGKRAGIHPRGSGWQVGAGWEAHGRSVGWLGNGLKINLAKIPFSAHNRGLENTPTNSINEVTGWRRLLVWLLATLLRVWGRTLRFSIDQESLARLTKSDEPVAFVLWHNRLFLTAEVFRRYRANRRLYALVSASTDGAWLAAFYREVGIHPVRGSSSRYGREAARALIEVMGAGHDIGITPDGPRGPLYTVEPGVLVVTRRSNTPMILFGAKFGRAIRLRSWDRFYIPWPFTRIEMQCRILQAKDASGEKLSADDVRSALLAINPDPPEV